MIFVLTNIIIIKQSASKPGVLSDHGFKAYLERTQGSAKGSPYFLQRRYFSFFFCLFCNYPPIVCLHIHSITLSTTRFYFYYYYFLVMLFVKVFLKHKKAFFLYPFGLYAIFSSSISLVGLLLPFDHFMIFL